MKILILGSGLMGPAAAYHAATDPAVAQVVLADWDQQQLERALKKFVGTAQGRKLSVVKLDLHNQAAAVELIAKFDAVVYRTGIGWVGLAALSWRVTTRLGRVGPAARSIVRLMGRGRVGGSG